MLISVAGLPPVMQVDTGRASVTASAGLRYGDLAPRLHVAGYALHNLGSLPHISISGACATGTHGSGDANGNLATAVSAMEIVTADGEVMVLSRDGDLAGRERFRGAVVGLGALGIVTSLVLDIVPAFDVRQYVYDDLPAKRLNTCFAEIFASAYSVRSPIGKARCTSSCGSSVGPTTAAPGDPSNAGWMPGSADGPRHPVPGMPPAYTTRQLGVPGPWHERLPHFRLDFTPSRGEELQSEYLLPRDRAVAAFDAMAGLSTRIGPVLQISEIRTVASDDLWLSPSYHRDTVALHFTWIKDMAAVTPVIAAVEERLAPLAARPHWGKLFGTAPPTLAALYQRFSDFSELIRGHDPAGKFRNEFMGRYFMAAG